jgi:hypothetical protein
MLEKTRLCLILMHVMRIFYCTYVGQTSWSLSLRFKEHTLHKTQQLTVSIRPPYPPTPVQIWHYWSLTLLQPVTSTSPLTPYEQFFIQSLGRTVRLTPEKNTGEPNPLFQLAFNPHPPSWPNQSGHILRAVHTSSSPALCDPGSFLGRQFSHLLPKLYSLYPTLTPAQHPPIVPFSTAPLSTQYATHA